MIKRLWDRFYDSHFLKFVFVGGLNTAIGYGVFATLVLLGVHYVVSSVIGHIVGVINSYFWNKYFTFRVPGKNYREIMRFIGVYTVHYIIGLSGLVLLVEVAKLHPLVGQAVILVITTLVSFFGHKYFTFKHAHPKGNQTTS